MMTTYLALVDKQRFTRNPKLLLVMKKDSDLFWSRILPQQILPLVSQYHHFAEGVFVLVEVDDKRNVTKVSLADTTIIIALQTLSLHLSNKDVQVQEWKDSIERQRLILKEREQQLLNNEDLLLQREELLKLKEEELLGLLNKIS